MDCMNDHPQRPMVEEHKDEERTIQHYSSLQDILLVGEGDFSFANAVATAFGLDRAGKIVATSLDSQETVFSKYPSARLTIKNLESLGVVLIYCVDATTMSNHELLQNLRFDRIIFNFPHSGFFGRETEKCVIRKHKALVRGFFQKAVLLLKRYGEVHVTHKTTPPFSEWKLEKQAAKSGLFMMEARDFCRFDYPGYVNRRGDGVNCGRTFPAKLSKTFKFALDLETIMYGSDLEDSEFALDLETIIYGSDLEDSSF